MTPILRPLPLPELAATWRTRAAELRRIADAEGAARALESAAADLDATLAAESDRLLTIREAAALSGRAPETLRKAIRQGRIPNAGRAGRPRVRSGDLGAVPARQTGRDRSARGKFDARADAQAILEVRRGDKHA